MIHEKVSSQAGLASFRWVPDRKTYVEDALVREADSWCALCEQGNPRPHEPSTGCVNKRQRVHCSCDACF